MFQGLKDLRRRNWEPFPVDPSSIDAVLLTHAHLDHVGYLPALVRDGFSGHIHTTDNSRALAQIVLPDSGRIHEEEARYASRKGYSKHVPPLPLYTEKDAFAALDRFRETPYDRPVDVADGIEGVFVPAGHILGAASIQVTIEGKTILFSGDLGRPEHPVLVGPRPPSAATTIVTESTYGDRRHDVGAALERFRDAIVRTAERGGVVVIPAFAVDRTEVLLYHLREMVEANQIPNLTVYADSPMALAALGTYRHAIAGGSPEIRTDLDRRIDLFDPGRLVEARDVESSRAINAQQNPCIIVSASGMATGGRVLHHLAQRLSDPRNTIVLPGFQAAGTRGRALLEGAATVKLLGRYVPVRAEIVSIPAFSVHADADELIGWLGSAPSSPATVYVVHGEPEAARALAGRVRSDLGWNAAVPAHSERVRLE